MKKFPIFICLLGLFILTFTACSSSETEEFSQLYTENSTSNLEQEILALVNDYRKSQGLNTLEFSSYAYTYAEAHTEEMIAKGEINHDDFDQRSSNLAVEAHANYVSENVGRNFTTAKGIVNAWINSPTHRKVMEGDFIASAVSAQVDDSGVIYYTQIFFK